MFKRQLFIALLSVLLIAQAVWSNRGDLLQADVLKTVNVLSQFSNNTSEIEKMKTAGLELVKACNQLANISETDFEFFELTRTYLEKFSKVVNQSDLNINVYIFLNYTVNDNDNIMRKINLTEICEKGLCPLYHQFLPDFYKLIMS